MKNPAVDPLISFVKVVVNAAHADPLSFEKWMERTERELDRFLDASEIGLTNKQKEAVLRELRR